MKNYIKISLVFLFVGCSKEIEIETLQERGGLLYEINSTEPFSGSVYKNYESGEKEIKGYLKKGKLDGFHTIWFENGQKMFENTYKEGKLISVNKMWNQDGSVRE